MSESETAKVDEALALIDMGVDVVIEAYNKIHRLKGEREAVLYLQMMLGHSSGWTQGKVASLAVGLIRRVVSVQGQLNGEPPF